MDAAAVPVLSALDGIFTSKEENRTALKAFLDGKYVFDLLPTGSGKSFVKHRDASPLATGR